MPLRKKTDIEPDESAYQELSRAKLYSSDAFEARYLPDPGLPEQNTLPRVGEFVADYSELTAEEIAQTDAESEELFKSSRPVSSTAAAASVSLECEELFSHSRPVSAAADEIDLELADLIRHSKTRSR